VLAWDERASQRARGWVSENVARSLGQPGSLPLREVRGDRKSPLQRPHKLVSVGHGCATSVSSAHLQ
jgi:hypothetical protein